jgi:hypothetical protein
VPRGERRMGDHVTRRHMVRLNTPPTFDLPGAGGNEAGRGPALSRDGFEDALRGHANGARLQCRKRPHPEATPAAGRETGQSIDMPLPTVAVEWLRELHPLTLEPEGVLPARKLRSRTLRRVGLHAGRRPMHPRSTCSTPLAD